MRTRYGGRCKRNSNITRSLAAVLLLYDAVIGMYGL